MIVVAADAGLSFRLSPLAGRGRSASAIRVRGSLRKGGDNRFENACQIARDVVIPKSQDPVIVISQPFVSDGIASVIRMLPAVYFDNQAAFPADEVHSVRSDRLLPNELVPHQAASTQLAPETKLRLRRICAELTGALRFELIGSAHAESPLTRPLRGRPLPASGERWRVLPDLCITSRD